MEVGKHSDYLRNLEFHAYFPILTRSLIYILNVRTRLLSRTSVFTPNTLPPYARSKLPSLALTKAGLSPALAVHKRRLRYNK